ncbi:MAG: alanine racemase [Candidatus Solibacter usitatus]|nr:alanine racemase [Candidatus Solibacter usitatus]
MNRRLRCWVEISREQLAANLHAIRSAVGSGVEVMPVVKADAYRHGAIEVSRTLIAGGVRWLAVSSVEEGVALRKSHIDARILIMGGVLPWEQGQLRDFELTPALHSLQEVRAAGPGPYHLKIDSGMGRMGTPASVEEIAAAVRAGTGTLEGLMTHFASSADFTSTQTESQTDRFTSIHNGLTKAGLAPRYVHLSSTNPVMLARPETWKNMVRPGIALYGYWAAGKGDAPRPSIEVKPVLRWKASIVLIKDVHAGAPLGYGAMFTAPTDMRIAVLGIGYADGLPHRLSNKGRIIAADKLCPILGAVSMDLTTIDISHAPELREGDAVTIIGTEGEATQTAQHIARAAGTISYSVLCGISARVTRVYL